MKRILLGTTALATASIFAAAGTPVAAQTLEERIQTLEESMLMGSPGGPFELTVSGYMTGGFFLYNADNGPGNDYAATDVKFAGGEIHFTATSHLDNGMTVGARVELEDMTADDQIDETYMWVEGGFGKAVLGAENGASYLMHYGAPWLVGLNGVDSPNFRHTATTAVRTSTQTHLTSDSNKITYFTPRFAGVQFGISYTPDASNARGGSANGWGLRDRTEAGHELHDVVDVAGNFTRDLGDFAVSASAGWESGSTKIREDDPVNWHIGAQVAARGLTIGGSYFTAEGFTGLSGTGGWQFPGCNDTLELRTRAAREQNAELRDHDNDPTTPEQLVTPAYDRSYGIGECVSATNVDLSSQLEQNAWAIGVQYGTGPWTVGIGYLDAKGKNYDGQYQDPGVDGVLGTGDDVIRTGGIREPETSVLQFGGSYSLAPGVTLAADVNFYEDKDGAGGSIESTGGGLMMGVSF